MGKSIDESTNQINNNHINSNNSSNTYINIRGIYVIGIRNTIYFIQYYTIIVIWNALLVLIFLFIILSQCVSTRVCFHFNGGLQNETRNETAMDEKKSTPTLGKTSMNIKECGGQKKMKKKKNL